jgi:hypothetical protein
MLYERVGNAQSLDTETKNSFGKIAAEEVKKAIDGLRAKDEDSLADSSS